MNKVADNLEKIKKQVDTNTLRVIAVTKYVGKDEILLALNAGIRDLAENRIQDAERKKLNS